MEFAFGIVSLFPGGGLQRDCIDIARKLKSRGHKVTIFTSRKSGCDFAGELPVEVLSVEARTNHARQRIFARKLIESSAGKFDLLVGFDKLNSLDVLYCSDRSMRARVKKNPLLNLLPRYRHYLDLERECFAPGNSTSILLLSEGQSREYLNYWRCEPQRLTVLPPTLLTSRRRPDYRESEIRKNLRAQFGVSAKDWVWLSICQQPKTKGLDRTVRALARYSDARLLICGLDPDDRKSKPIIRLANRLGVSDRIVWLGHREDIPEVMAAADLFVHPARHETTGTALLEAVVNGLPVVVSEICGYSSHVRTANAGLLIKNPYSERLFIEALDAARDRGHSHRWSQFGAEYGVQKELYDGCVRAAEFLIDKANEKVGDKLRIHHL